jgi:PAS domain S-box-containing protein
MITPAGLLQAFFDTAQDVMLVVDAATRRIVHASPSAARDTGYSHDELVGMSLPRLLGPARGDSEEAAGDIGTAAGPMVLRLIGRNGDAARVTVMASAFQWGAARHLLLIARREQPVPAAGSGLGPEREDFPTIIGQSAKIRDVCRRIGSLAKSDVTVLIQGESGTGKEIIAGAVHAHSHRGRGPLVKVNCAALSETLLESELFGHVKGAFTGAIRDRRGRFKQAEGGTIFLDEVGSMSLAGQAKLLRVLQEHEFEPVGSSVTVPVDVRVIAATNADLARAVAEGRFREDLFYRLNVFLIALPPLRDRKEDIGLLAQHFLDRYAQTLSKPIRAIGPETLQLLVDHDWPGNVRELENAIEHAVIIEDGPTLSPASLPMNLDRSAATTNGRRCAEPGLRDKLNTVEKQILIEALTRANGIRKHAAAMLGVDARNLPYLLRKHRLCEQLGGGLRGGGRLD